jgi:WD40 repeat protein
LGTIFQTGHTFWSVGIDGSFSRWDLHNLQQPTDTYEWKGFEFRPMSVCSDEADGLIVGGIEGKVWTLRVSAKMEVVKLPVEARGAILSVAQQQKSRGALAIASLDGSLRVWRKKDREIDKDIVWEMDSIVDSMLGCCWNPKQTGILAAARSDKRILLCDIEGGVGQVDLGAKFPTCLAYENSGSVLCVGALDGGIVLVRTASETV